MAWHTLAALMNGNAPRQVIVVGAGVRAWWRRGGCLIEGSTSWCWRQETGSEAVSGPTA
jgi:hypothetical protein